MRCTGLRIAGNFSRATVAQQQHQQQTSPSSSQHRSTSVLASLLRMRTQFQRLRGAQQQQVIATVLARTSKDRRLLGAKTPPLPSASGEDGTVDGPADAEAAAGLRSTASAVQAGVLLCTEAQRLLRGDARAADPLSDVATSSPLYFMEAGKLLTSAAAFGAATTFPRVREICAWIRANADSLQTPRQVMSLATPLMNMTDGATGGVQFVLEVLYEPLLLALQDVGRGNTVSSAADGASEEEGSPHDSATTSEQQLVAIASAFSMVAKWSNTFLSQLADTEAAASDVQHPSNTAESAVAVLHEEREKMLTLAVASVAALARHTRERDGDGAALSNATTPQQFTVGDVSLWLQCMHGLEKAFRTSSSTKAESEAAVHRLRLCYRVLMPLTQRTLESLSGNTHSPSSAVDGAPTSVGPGSLMASAAGVSHLRVQDVVDLIQGGLFQSVDAQHTELVLQHGLHALPNALNAASVREMCLVSQVVNRVRQQQPASALPAPLLRAILAALRPRLFLLRESQAYQLRPLDCSVLLSQLSRWEDVHGVTVSADVVELLSQRFGEQMTTVEAPQLVPFVQALARLEDRHRSGQSNGNRGAAQTSAAAMTNAFIDGQASAAPRATAATTVTSARKRRRAKTQRYAYCSTARVLAQCAQRISVLATGAGEDAASATVLRGPESSHDKQGSASVSRLSATDAAYLLVAFAQLDSPQVDFVFTKVEPLLVKGLSSAPASTAAAAAPTAPVPSSSSDALHARAAVLDAITRFVELENSCRTQDNTTDAAENETRSYALQRAKTLLSAHRSSEVEVVRQATRPKDLVMVTPLVRRRLSTTRTVADEEGDIGVPETAPPRRARGAGDDDGGSSSSSSGKKAYASKKKSRSRADVQLASVFAKQVVVVAPECNGYELGVLSNAVGVMAAAGVLPASSTRRAVQALWSRCASGLAAAAENGDDHTLPSTASSAAVVMTMEDCKKLMDASRTAFPFSSSGDYAVCPPAFFLETCAALCKNALASMTAQVAAAASPEMSGGHGRGTAAALRKSAGDLRTYTNLGRSMVSYYALLPEADVNTADDVSAQREAWRAFAEAYLEVMRAAMENFAAETTLAEASSPPSEATRDELSFPVQLSLLSFTARVVTQLQRLLHRRSRRHPQAQPVGLDADGEEFRAAGVMDEAEGSPLIAGGNVKFVADTVVDEAAAAAALEEEEESAAASLAVVDETVTKILALLGDTIASSTRQRQQVQGQAQLDEDAVTPPSPPPPPSAASAIHPKDLLMLLQAFESVRYRHPEMLYSLLPELRSCADDLDPLELSLLLRALAQLGAWNSRLLRVLAAAVETKMRSCELRQCHSLLRGLCRSGCVSRDTYVELRGSAYEDWAHAGTRRGDAPQEPLQRLAESALWRLDALVRTRQGFFALTKTATLTDLVSVVTALSFFHVPPPATYDAFVVLAVRRLAQSYAAMPIGNVVRDATALLGAVSELRRPAQQRVSARAVWAVLQRALAPSRRHTSAALDKALTLQMCGELWRLACLHTLRYGEETTQPVLEGFPASSLALFSRLDERLSCYMTAYAWGPAPAAATAADGKAAVEVGSAGDGTEEVVGMAASSGGRSVPPLSRYGQAALRRCSAHAAPSLVRSDRDVAEEHLSFPMRLAQRVAEDGRDLSTLVRLPPLLTAPAAQAKAYVRLMACLLRADVWDSNPSTSTNRTLLVAALHRLWQHADLHDLLSSSADVFTTEELLVLAAASAHFQQASGVSVVSDSDAVLYRERCLVALQLLCRDSVEWRVAAAVDAWVLFTCLAAPPAATSLRFSALPDDVTERVCALLARSGCVFLEAFLQAEASSSTVSSTRVLPELMRLFSPHHATSLLSFVRSVEGAAAFGLDDINVSVSAEVSARKRFAAYAAAFQKCIAYCVAKNRQG